MTTKNQKKKLAILLVAVGFLITIPLSSEIDAKKGNNRIPDTALLPDIIPSIPKHLQVQNTQQTETLRFTNAWGNTGSGSLDFFPIIPGEISPDSTQDALQRLHDADGNIIWEQVVSEFEFHDTHNHWHIGSVGEFAVREATSDGPGDIVILSDDKTASSIKVGFCIIDVYQIDGSNSPTSQREFWDCEVTEQGIQPGWMDQYHQSTEGNEVPITNLDPGTYYLTNEWNPAGNFIDESSDNDVSWMKFDLTRDSNGNAKITELEGFSPGCTPDAPGLCGEISRNN